MADNKLRYLFQRMASLSSTAQNLSSKFQNEPLEIQDRKEKIKSLEESFEKQGLDKRDIQIEDTNERIRKPEHIWTRISLLWIGINEWENQPEYKNFFKNHSNRFKSMKDEFGSLAEKVSHCFALVEVVEKTPDLKSALQDCADHYTLRLKKHLEKVSDFISCTLLNVKKGDARLDAIRQIGFKPSYNEGLSIDLLALLFIMLFVVFIVVFGVFYPNSSQAVRPMAAFVKAIMIPGMLTFSIAFATLAKKSCDRKGKTQHAYATYGFWAAVSVAIGSIISILMNTIVNNWNLHSGFDAFVGRGLFVDDPKAPWQLLVFAATFLIAYQLNHQKDDRIDHLKLRVKEAISMSLVLCIAFLIAGHLMSFTPKEFLAGVLL